MKLLLTSAGLRNKTLVRTFLDLLGKPIAESRLLFVPTAANADPGDKWWLLEDLNAFWALKPLELDIVDFAGLPKELWLPRLEAADCLIFGGGNTLHLMKSMLDENFHELLKKWLDTKLYVGVSAGSIVTGPTLGTSSSMDVYQEKYNVKLSDQALGLVDFYVRPHFQNPDFPLVTEENVTEQAKSLGSNIYLLDDGSGVVVDGTSVRVVSEGAWKLLGHSSKV